MKRLSGTTDGSNDRPTSDRPFDNKDSNGSVHYRDSSSSSNARNTQAILSALHDDSADEDNEVRFQDRT